MNTIQNLEQSIKALIEERNRDKMECTGKNCVYRKNIDKLKTVKHKIEKYNNLLISTFNDIENDTAAHANAHAAVTAGLNGAASLQLNGNITGSSSTTHSISSPVPNNLSQLNKESSITRAILALHNSNNAKINAAFGMNFNKNLVNGHGGMAANGLLTPNGSSNLLPATSEASLVQSNSAANPISKPPATVIKLSSNIKLPDEIEKSLEDEQERCVIIEDSSDDQSKNLTAHQKLKQEQEKNQMNDTLIKLQEALASSPEVVKNSGNNKPQHLNLPEQEIQSQNVNQSQTHVKIEALGPDDTNVGTENTTQTINSTLVQAGGPKILSRSKKRGIEINEADSQPEGKMMKNSLSTQTLKLENEDNSAEIRKSRSGRTLRAVERLSK